jgi:hypothetical protein
MSSSCIHGSHSSEAGALVVKCALAKSFQIFSSSAHKLLQVANQSQRHAHICQRCPKSGNKPYSPSGNRPRFWMRSVKELSTVSYMNTTFPANFYRDPQSSQDTCTGDDANLVKSIEANQSGDSFLDSLPTCARPHIFFIFFFPHLLALQPSCLSVELSMNLSSFYLREMTISLVEFEGTVSGEVHREGENEDPTVDTYVPSGALLWCLLTSYRLPVLCIKGDSPILVFPCLKSMMTRTQCFLARMLIGMIIRS